MTQSREPQLCIVQPWFTAPGHPAQSTINTARILGDAVDVTYLVSQETHNGTFQPMIDRLAALGSLETFTVPSASVRVGTIAALWHLAKMARRGIRSRSILFLDGHLVVLASFWFLFSRIVKPRRLSLLYLQGPERAHRHFVVRHVTSRFLQRKEVKLFLRTDELRDAWRERFPRVPPERINVVPSLELPESSAVPAPLSPSPLTRLGVIGQIRQGKSLEWLIPLFSAHPALGILTVAGTFFDEEQRNALPVIKAYPHFRDGFLSDDELVRVASEQDYLLMLYERWDARMEGATLYLAARANRPVVVYESGWCGRIVRTYGCGVIAPSSHGAMATFFERLPRNSTPAYRALLSGLEKFRHAHSGSAVRTIFIQQVVKTEDDNVP